jgi:hypothetical protein
MIISMQSIRNNFIIDCFTILNSNDIVCVKNTYDKLFSTNKNILGDNKFTNVSCFIDVIARMLIDESNKTEHTYTQDKYTRLKRIITITKQSHFMNRLLEYLLCAVLSDECKDINDNLKDQIIQLYFMNFGIVSL